MQLRAHSSVDQLEFLLREAKDYHANRCKDTINAWLRQIGG